MRTFITAVTSLFLLAGCQALPTPTAPSGAVDKTIASRDTRIPITLTRPPASAPAPLVVMLHGHGGSRHEAGGYTQVADRLAAAGVASIRMDFAGCGDSTEPFRNQRLITMLADARAARDWAVANANIDTTRMALVGFSMGGRLAITLAAEDSGFSAMALWAPSADNGATALYDFFGGVTNYEQMRARAAQNEFVPFTTTWGQQQELSSGWFTDMAASRPLQLVGGFTGKLLVLYGNNDTVVVPAEAERVIQHATSAAAIQRYVVQGADHGLGLFSNEPHLTEQAVAQTVEFLTAALQ